MLLSGHRFITACTKVSYHDQTVTKSLKPVTMLWEEIFVLGVISTNICNDPFLFHFWDNLCKIQSKEFKLADKNLSLSFVHILEVLYKINPIIGYEVWTVSNIIKHYQALKMINSEKIIIRKEISTSDYSKKFWNSVTHCAVIIPNMDKKDLNLRISKPITMWVGRKLCQLSTFHRMFDKPLDL